MPAILVTMAEDACGKVIDAETGRLLQSLGEVTWCLDAHRLPLERYAELWTTSDAAVTGWGVRPPAEEWLPAGSRLRAICHAAGSVRMFPRRLIERGVVVTSARAAIARTVAEFCLCATLMLLRRLVGRASAGDRPPTATLFGKTVVLVGLGYVGRHFLDLLRPFGCRVIAVDPALSSEQATALGVETGSLHEALPKADIVSLHVPDIPSTRGMIGAGELALIRDGGVLVNTARGRVVETDALTAELATGRLRGALDVTDPEPLPANHPLRAMASVLLTPHVAGPTTDELPQLGRTAVADLARVLRGDAPAYPIGLAAYDAMSF